MPFIPINGVALELWDSESDEAWDIELTGVKYSFREASFIEELIDEELLDKHRAGCYTKQDQDDKLSWYAQFGFKRIYGSN